MRTLAVVLSEPRTISLDTVALSDPGPADAVVEVAHSAISAGTERRLWDGSMPDFPGLGYPLVPGYESVGRVVEAGPQSGRCAGEAVFVPGSRGFDDVRPLFGGTAQTLVCEGAKLLPVAACEPSATLIALAATARHILTVSGPPDLVIGHGVLGRLIARIARAEGHAVPTVHETVAARREGGIGPVLDPAEDEARYATIVDASGRADVIDATLPRLSRSGTLVLAGFYDARLSFAFPPAFMKEASIRIAAEWRPADLAAVSALLEAGALRLDGLITHSADAADASAAYATALTDPACLKMVLNWKGQS